MDQFKITGGVKLKGEITVSGAKNVAMKVILAGLLTDETLIVKNCPDISSVRGTIDLVKSLGVNAHFIAKNILKIHFSGKGGFTIPLELGGLYRTATMVLGPLLSRYGQAVVPNPGGCRLGKRPIDRHIEGLEKLGAQVEYRDGYFFAKTDKLTGCRFKFNKNTHTGTETMILSSVLAHGQTVLENAAQEPEVDDLIKLLNMMGAKIKRIKPRVIAVTGVKKLHGTEFEVMPDRNEVITFAIASVATGGDVIVSGANSQNLEIFLNKLTQTGSKFKILDRNRIRFYQGKAQLTATNIKTSSYPGFMTDWQAPWALLMTQAKGFSTIHETVFEDRFGYVRELKKMGAQITYFNPQIKNPDAYYNFNLEDKKRTRHQAIRIKGPTRLHNAILEVSDLRAGATLVLGGLIARGETIVAGIEHIERGYEQLEDRLKKLGGLIERDYGK